MPTFETSTIDRLFLELSQFTKARSRREMMLEGALHQIADLDPNVRAGRAVQLAKNTLRNVEE